MKEPQARGSGYPADQLIVDNQTCRKITQAKRYRTLLPFPDFGNSVADRIAALSPAALAACKHCFSAADAPIGSGMLIELLETHKLFNTADTRNRVKAFLDK